MNTMKWLLRREFWEHKGGFVWAPVIAALIMLVLVGGVLGYGVASGKMASDSITVRVNGEEVRHTSVSKVLTEEKRTEVASMAANNYIVVGAPILVVLPVVLLLPGRAV